MSGSVNKVILVGNLGRDPETKQFASGDSVTTFSLATSESWKDKTSGEKRERTEWHNVVIFNEGLGKVAQQYLKKGSKVYLEGQVQTRKYQDKNGQEKQSTEIVLQRFRGELTILSDGNSGGGSGGRSTGSRSGGSTASRPAARDNQGSSDGAGTRGDEPLDDDIPF